MKEFIPFPRGISSKLIVIMLLEFKHTYYDVAVQHVSHYTTQIPTLFLFFKFLNFFIIQHVKARAIPCPHQPPTRGDNTGSVAQGSTATPGATKQLLDRVLRELYIYIYIYMPDQLRGKTTLDVNLHF